MEVIKLGFLIRFQAKEGKENELEQAMKKALSKVQEETGTITWFAFRFAQSEFGVIDTFYDEEARQIHWEAGKNAVEEHLQSLIVKESLSVNKIDIVAAKL